MVLRFGEEDFKRDSKFARAYPKLPRRPAGVFFGTPTYKFIGWVLGLPERTVQAICARWKKRGNLRRAKYQHRPRRLTEKQIDWLCKPKQIQDWRSFTLEERCQKILAKWGVPVRPGQDSSVRSQMNRGPTKGGRHKASTIDLLQGAPNSLPLGDRPSPLRSSGAAEIPLVDDPHAGVGDGGAAQMGDHDGGVHTPSDRDGPGRSPGGRERTLVLRRDE